jgi:cytoskeletal protein RodZ
MTRTDTTEAEPLASFLLGAMQKHRVSVEEIAESTKVPRSTLRALLGDSGPAVLPPRIYLRGHLGLVASALELDPEEALRLFDETYPPDDDAPLTSDLPRLRMSSMAIAAGLTGVGILAVILAFAR